VPAQGQSGRGNNPTKRSAVWRLPCTVASPAPITSRKLRARDVYAAAGYRPDGRLRESDFEGAALREVRLVKDLNWTLAGCPLLTPKKAAGFSRPVRDR